MTPEQKIKHNLRAKKYRENNKEKIKKEKALYSKNNKEQIAIKQKEYLQNNKEHIKIKQKEYREKNKEKIKETNKIWRENNLDKDKEKERLENYYNDNREKLSIQQKEWRINNKKHIVIYSKNYRINNKEKISLDFKYRYNNDIIFKLKVNIKNSINNSLRKNGYTKKSTSHEILGCSFEEFKSYLESKFEPWMNWENRGLYNGNLNYGWDIDHVIPLSNTTTEEELLKLNHFSNLQPLCSKINRDIKRNN